MSNCSSRSKIGDISEEMETFTAIVVSERVRREKKNPGEVKSRTRQLQRRDGGKNIQAAAGKTLQSKKCEEPAKLEEEKTRILQRTKKIQNLPTVPADPRGSEG